MKTTDIHGKKVMYEENAQSGIDYLRSSIDRDAATLFFDQAKSKGIAKFENQSGVKFELAYRNSTFFLARDSGGGGDTILGNVLPF